MVVDYEAAWIKLQGRIASKTQHGREGLLTAMAEIADESRVATGELPTLLRLQGVEIGRARLVSTDIRDEPSPSDADVVGAGTAAPRPSST